MEPSSFENDSGHHRTKAVRCSLKSYLFMLCFDLPTDHGPYNPSSKRASRRVCINCKQQKVNHSTSGENAFVICGSLIHLAMRIGIHIFPSSQGFARTKLRLSDKDLRRRAELWAHCVILHARSSYLLKCLD